MAKKKILVVDDTEFNRDLVVQLLEEDYDMVIAENGAEALTVSASERPDLILMDLGMPVMDGWEATRRLKANDELKEYSGHRRHFPCHGRRRDRSAQSRLRRLSAQTHRRRTADEEDQKLHRMMPF